MNLHALTLNATAIAALGTDALVALIPAKTPSADKSAAKSRAAKSAAAAHSTLPAPIQQALQDAQNLGDFEGKAGQVWLQPHPHGLKAKRLLLVGLGEVKAQDPGVWQKAALAAMSALKPLGVAQAHLWLGDWSGATLSFAVETLAVAAHAAAYVYTHTKPSASKTPAKLKQFHLCAPAAALPAVKAGLAKALAVAHGVELAREWGNRPANHATPTHLAQVAKGLAKSHKLGVEVLDRKQCEKLGMGAFLAVTQGSQQPPQFIVIKYQGAAKTEAPVVLVGKGITFDTGGISIKGAGTMDEMKFDMSGAGSVLGTMQAVAELKLKRNVIGVIPACENMPDGHAIKPGDVVTTMSGQTVEILNTDAEGRLVLCDALTYVERFKPAAVIDVATLTGACVVALGHHRSGLFTPHDGLAQQLSAAGERSGDVCWRMPLDEEYGEGLKSNFADIPNIGGPSGGAITGAMFLKKFTQAYPWAHLDIAGVAWKSGGAKGSTGRPVPLLTELLIHWQAL